MPARDRDTGEALPRLPAFGDCGGAHRPPHGLKTLSYFAVHLTVAALVAYAVTGNLAAAMAIGLIEPTVQAVAYFLHERVWERRFPGGPTARLPERLRPYLKTLTYSLVHFAVAPLVAFAVTGSLAAALAIGLMEPFAQVFGYHLHEWAWRRSRATRRLRTA